MPSRKRRRTSSKQDVFVYSNDTDLNSIPKSITSLRIDSSVKIIPPKAFYAMKSLTNVEYEEGLQVIGDEAFRYCNRLREQQFPSTLVEIGIGAFSECKQLTSVGRLPSSLTLVRGGAFQHCAKLKNFEIDNNNDSLRLEGGVFGYCSSLTHFRLPRGMTTIPHSLFSHCESLVDVDMPSSVIEIKSDAFGGCTKLALRELPAALKGLRQWRYGMLLRIGIGDASSKLKEIPANAFEGCHKLKDISIPQSVVEIWECGLSCCGLIELDLSRLNISYIANSAFSYCYHLKFIWLPRKGLKVITEKCFLDCQSLTHLWIPPTVEDIEKGAFSGCRSLVSVEVPENLGSLVFVGQDYEIGVLGGYESLVNIFIPPPHQLDDVSLVDVGHGFMQFMKLGQAESDYPELVRKLKQRFHSLPLHRACYFQSYKSLQENIKRIQSIVQSDIDGPARACQRTDFLGMTPLHILALSHRPWLNLFQALISLSSSSVDIILYYRDVFGSTPLEYLCRNESSAGKCVTKSLLVQIMEPRISFLGLEIWRDELMQDLFATVESEQMDEDDEDDDTLSLATKVSSLCQKLAMLERMEVLSLLEMTLWKMKINDENATGSDARENCRISCESSTVVEHVIPLL